MSLNYSSLSAKEQREHDLLLVKQKYEELIGQIKSVKNAFSNELNLNNILEDLLAHYTDYINKKISLETFKSRFKGEIFFVRDEITFNQQKLGADKFKELSKLADDLITITELAPKNLQRMEQMAQLQPYLNNLKKKSKQFEKQKELRAKCTVDTLISIMENFADLYVVNKLTLDEFKKNSERVIDNAHSVSDKHRGYKTILHNLAYFIKTLGVGYTISAFRHGSFFPKRPNTDTKDKVDELQAQVASLPPK